MRVGANRLFDDAVGQSGAALKILDEPHVRFVLGNHQRVYERGLIDGVGDPDWLFNCLATWHDHDVARIEERVVQRGELVRLGRDDLAEVFFNAACQLGVL